MQDEAINMNDNFSQFLPSIMIQRFKSPVYSFLIKLCFPFEIIYLPDGCEANAITFVLPSNNKLNVDPIDESGFNRLYSK